MSTPATPGPEPLPRRGSCTVLRRLAATDLDAFQAYRHDAEVQRYQGWQPLQDSDAWAFIEEMAIAPLFHRGQWVQIGIADASDRALVGDIGVCISADGKSAEIGFTICRQSQGRGLGTDAVGQAIRLLFECTAAARIVGVTDSRNLASIRLLERVGMRRVATRHTVFNGEPCIEHSHAVSRHDGG